MPLDPDPFVVFLSVQFVIATVCLFVWGTNRIRKRQEKIEVPDAWVIDVNDIVGRWDLFEGSDLRNAFRNAELLIHCWNDKEGMTFDEVCTILRHLINMPIMLDGGRYSKRPLRIRNVKTGDFMPLEVLGIEKDEVLMEEYDSDYKEKKKMQALHAKMQQMTMGGAVAPTAAGSSKSLNAVIQGLKKGSTP